jgi:DNA repair exonuclease SbcCD ATPase subunit
MDYLDSGIRIAQSVLPTAFQYLGKTKEREEKLTHTEEELSETKARLEVLVMKNHELSGVHEQVKVLTEKNQELTEANHDLEAFKSLVTVLAVIAVVVLIGMALTSERVALA